MSGGSGAVDEHDYRPRIGLAVVLLVTAAVLGVALIVFGVGWSTGW